MKYVVTIDELHKLIPETKKLEGTNFKDIKQLLLSVINAIEISGAWEYVQYIAGNPSLFIVKSREINQTYIAATKNAISAEEEIKNHYEPKDISVKSVSKSKKQNDKSTEEAMIQLEEKENKLNKPISTDKLFKETDLPW